MARITDRQKDALIHFLEVNPKLVTGKLDNSFTCQIQERLWISLSESLNCMGGAVKAPEKWKRAWYDMKLAAKAKAASIRDHSRKTGGGPATNEVLSPSQERIVALLGEVQIGGDPKIMEGGFGEPEVFVEVNIEDEPSTSSWDYPVICIPSPPETSQIGEKRQIGETPPAHQQKKFKKNSKNSNSSPAASERVSLSAELLQSQMSMATSLEAMVAIGDRIAKAEEAKAIALQQIAQSVEIFLQRNS